MATCFATVIANLCGNPRWVEVECFGAVNCLRVDPKYRPVLLQRVRSCNLFSRLETKPTTTTFSHTTKARFRQ